MIGIRTKWACPTCEWQMTVEGPFDNEYQRKNIPTPTKCGGTTVVRGERIPCTRTKGFELFDFNRVIYVIK